MAIKFHRRTLHCLSRQTVMLPPTDSCHLLISYVRSTLLCPYVCYLYVFTTSLYISYFCTLLYFTMFHLNYELGLITISQRGKENVIEDRWCQDHSTNKWEETVDKNIDHMLDQGQRRGKKNKEEKNYKKVVWLCTNYNQLHQQFTICA